MTDKHPPELPLADMGPLNPKRDTEYIRCPTCGQYSHSIGGDRFTAAFNHFQSMTAMPVQNAFDKKTRDYAQVMVAEIERLKSEKWRAQHVDTMNDAVLTKLAMDHMAEMLKGVDDTLAILAASLVEHDEELFAIEIAIIKQDRDAIATTTGPKDE